MYVNFELQFALNFFLSTIFTQIKVALASLSHSSRWCGVMVLWSGHISRHMVRRWMSSYHETRHVFWVKAFLPWPFDM
jgi:hypothetical protein